MQGSRKILVNHSFLAQSFEAVYVAALAASRSRPLIKYKTNNVPNAPANKNFIPGAKLVGETNPSTIPATSNKGIVPKTSRTLFAPARTSDSFRANTPGNNNP